MYVAIYAATWQPEWIIAPEIGEHQAAARKADRNTEWRQGLQIPAREMPCSSSSTRRYRRGRRKPPGERHAAVGMAMVDL
jgi:hypothetical protein